MDPGQRLPPITTQLAGYFQRTSRPTTPPVSPHDTRRSSPDSSLKRKRPSPGPGSDAQTAQDLKRSATEWTAPQLAARESYDAPQAQRIIDTRESSRSHVPGPLGSSARDSPVYPRRSGPALPPDAHSASPTVGTPHSSDDYFRKSAMTEQGHRTSGDSGISYRTSAQQPVRTLPPLEAPHSPRSASYDRSASGSTGPRQPLPPVEPVSSYQAAPTGYETSSYPYPPPTHAPQHQYPYESSRATSSYAFDPIRQSSYATEERRPLPPISSMSSPVPPPAAASHARMHSTPVSAHSVDRYTFDAGPQTDQSARRRRGNLPKEATSVLNDWFAAHASYPYPKEDEKTHLQEMTGLSMSQIGNWFINARRRRKPTTTNAQAMEAAFAPPPPPRGPHAYGTQPAGSQPPPHPSSFPPHPSLSQGPGSLPAGSLPPMDPGRERQPYDYSRLPPPPGPYPPR